MFFWFVLFCFVFHFLQVISATLFQYFTAALRMTVCVGAVFKSTILCSQKKEKKTHIILSPTNGVHPFNQNSYFTLLMSGCWLLQLAGYPKKFLQVKNWKDRSVVTIRKKETSWPLMYENFRWSDSFSLLFLDSFERFSIRI